MENENLKHLIYLAATAVIIFGAYFLPGAGCITDYGMTILVIFVGLIFGYCTCGIVVPSCMALLALGLSGYASVPEVLMMSFGSDTVLYIISILILSAMLVECGLSNKLVGIIVSAKAIKGHPWVLSTAFLVAAYVVSLFINSVPSVIMVWSLLLGLFERAGYKGGERWPLMMLFGAMYFATVGACVPSFQISIASNFGLLKTVSRGELVLNPSTYMAWSFICSLFLMTAYLLFARFVINPDMTRVKNLELSDGSQDGGFTSEQKPRASFSPYSSLDCWFRASYQRKR